MTIKKRLFISNILMLVIPAMFAIIVLISCLFIFWVSMFPHAEYELGFRGELTEMRYEAVELASDWLSESNANRKGEIESALSQLAEKIENNPSEPRYIQTVWGAGYRFEP